MHVQYRILQIGRRIQRHFLVAPITMMLSQIQTYQTGCFQTIDDLNIEVHTSDEIVFVFLLITAVLQQCQRVVIADYIIDQIFVAFHKFVVIIRRDTG